MKTLDPLPQVAQVTEDDLKPFALPVPGAWSKIMASEATPGLSAKHRDAAGKSVNAFSDSLAGTPLELSLSSNHTLVDALTGSVWDTRGKRIDGALEADLEPIALSDEYWFSWRRFHPRSELIHV